LWVLTALVVTVLVVGVVSISAFLVRASFRVEEVRRSIAALQAEHDRLATDVVTLSAPSRIAEWARSHGMVRADDVQVLRVRVGERS
jgi:cell division protein FtsL